MNDYIEAGEDPEDYETAMEHDLENGVDPTEEREAIGINYNADGSVEANGSIRKEYFMDEDIDKVTAEEGVVQRLEGEEPSGLDDLDTV